MRAPSENDVGPGWRNVVRTLLHYCVENDIEVKQIKEKFGSLCFYTNQAPDSIFGFIVEGAESKCSRLCEWCGKYGKKHPGGWVKTLCSECAGKWDTGERWWGEGKYTNGQQ